MRKALAGIGSLVFVSLVAGCDLGTDTDDSQRFVAVLTGSSEVPPVTTAATGRAEFELNEAETELEFELEVSNMEGLVQSHIHFGPQGQNGPIVVFLLAPIQGGLNVTGTQQIASGTITQAEVREAAGFSGTFAGLIDAIEQGTAYVNVHTTAHGAGEIRGQISELP